MQALLLGLALLAPPSATVERDAYGVAKVTAPTFEAACFAFGQVVAEDRLWQMENARRVARGRMAEVYGRDSLRSDQEVLRTAYTDEELSAMVAGLGEPARVAMREYAKGVNATIQARKAAGTLPEGYARLGFEPQPWTELDSAAISVMLARRFGTGGAGELRNMALWLYLQTQPVRERTLDVVDDFLWFNDARAIPTVSELEDPLKASPPTFPLPDRATTEAHLAALPKVSLLELASSIRAVEMRESELVAQAHGVPYKTGSYAVVVGKGRSATGRPMLLSGPQMGLDTPAVVHEVAIDAPGLKVVGINVPGVPAIVVGNTPYLAWGLTTGVGDVTDIVWAKTDGPDSYLSGGQKRPIQRLKWSIPVKGQAPVEFVAERTHDGPVVLNSRSGGAVFSQRSGHWKKELSSWASLFDVYRARSKAQLETAEEQISVNFNFFFATRDGDIGWRYTGDHPVRAAGFDPRFPIPSGPEAEWKGFLGRDRLPRVDNPPAGLIVNWNNKPATWWPNGDTPAWGRLFRNQALAKFLRQQKVTLGDLERAVWAVARYREDDGAFMPFFQKVVDSVDEVPLAWRVLDSFGGWALDGDPAATLYDESVSQLRRLLFRQHVGNFTNDRFFEIAVQPSVMLEALEGRTKFDYLAGRTRVEVAQAAMEAAIEKLTKERGPDPLAWAYRAGAFRTPNGPPVPYGNRGTYIQITTFGEGPIARSVLPPGVAETGPHEADQVALARGWTYKPVWPVRD